MRLDASDITQAEPGDLGTQPGVTAVAGIHQHDARRNTGGPRGADLVQCDVGFAGKTRRFRHPGLGPARGIRRPLQWQIQPVGDRQAGRVVGNRQGDRYLAIVLLAANFGVSGRRFRFKPAGGFGGNRQAISVQSGTPLRRGFGTGFGEPPLRDTSYLALACQSKLLL